MGACVDYPEKFTKPYMELVHGAVIGDRDIVHKKSIGKSYSTNYHKDLEKQGVSRDCFVLVTAQSLVRHHITPFLLF